MRKRYVFILALQEVMMTYSPVSYTHLDVYKRQPILFLAGFSLGIGLILAAVTVKFRDIMHLYSVFTTALMYLTPVIYPMSILPDWLSPIVKANPVTYILLMFRDVMLNGNFPNILGILIAFIETVLALGVGLYVFYKNQDQFILNI